MRCSSFCKWLTSRDLSRRTKSRASCNFTSGLRNSIVMLFLSFFIVLFFCSSCARSLYTSLHCHLNRVSTGTSSLFIGLSSMSMNPIIGQGAVLSVGDVGIQPAFSHKVCACFHHTVTHLIGTLISDVVRSLKADLVIRHHTEQHLE